MSTKIKEGAQAFIEQQGLSPTNCYLRKSGDSYILTTILSEGQELDWFDDREDRIQRETWRQLIEAGVEVRN
jgi:hypothetical protein